MKSFLALRPAVSAWDEDHTEKLGPLNMACGKAAPVCFRGWGSETRALVYRKHFVVAGPKQEVSLPKWLMG